MASLADIRIAPLYQRIRKYVSKLIQIPRSGSVPKPELGRNDELAPAEIPKFTIDFSGNDWQKFLFEFTFREGLLLRDERITLPQQFSQPLYGSPPILRHGSHSPLPSILKNSVSQPALAQASKTATQTGWQHKRGSPSISLRSYQEPCKSCLRRRRLFLPATHRIFHFDLMPPDKPATFTVHSNFTGSKPGFVKSLDAKRQHFGGE